MNKIKTAISNDKPADSIRKKDFFRDQKKRLRFLVPKYVDCTYYDGFKSYMKLKSNEAGLKEPIVSEVLAKILFNIDVLYG